MPIIPLSPDALTALRRENPGTWSALAAQPWMGVDVDASWPQPLQDWVRTLPCPVIGIGHAPDRATASACDVIVPDTTSAEPLIARIQRTPLAAATLVQTLRVCETLPLAEALTVESLAYATLQGGAEFAAWRAQHPPSATPPDPTDSPAVRIERNDDALHLCLNRPTQRNAMTVEMRDALVEALTLAVCDDSLRQLHLSAAGKCFSTGGDPTEFGTAPDTATAHAVRSVTLPGRLLAACAARAQMTAQVTLHGACIGSGIEFPAFAGRLIAQPNAWFQLPELDYGLIPGAGGCVSIARRIGRQRMAAWVLSGARINAYTALEWGLIDAIAA